MLTAVAGVLALRRPGALSTAGAVGVAGGVPLIVVGRVVGPPWEQWAALVLAAATCVIAGLLAAEARTRRDEARGWRVLQGGSALGLVVGMALVIADALGRAMGTPMVAPATLETVHGTATAVGFGLLGALAWSDTRSDP